MLRGYGCSLSFRGKGGGELNMWCGTRDSKAAIFKVFYLYIGRPVASGEYIHLHSALENSTV
jgi:hypothetical protein